MGIVPVMQNQREREKRPGEKEDACRTHTHTHTHTHTKACCTADYQCDMGPDSKDKCITGSSCLDAFFRRSLLLQ